MAGMGYFWQGLGDTLFKLYNIRRNQQMAEQAQKAREGLLKKEYEFKRQYSLGGKPSNSTKDLIDLYEVLDKEEKDLSGINIGNVGEGLDASTISRIGEIQEQKREILKNIKDKLGIKSLKKNKKTGGEEADLLKKFL